MPKYYHNKYKSLVKVLLISSQIYLGLSYKIHANINKKY